MIARRLEPELMDQPGLDPSSHRAALAGLSRINAWSRSAAALWPAVRRVAAAVGGRPVRVLDVASGAGDVLLELSRRAHREGIALEGVGIDVSPLAVTYARERSGAAAEMLRFEVHDIFRDELPERFDLSVSSLFLHHLSSEQAVELLRRMAAASEHCLAINDLRRSRLGIAAAHVACRLLTRSPIVHADGPQSVAAAFTVEEMALLFERAGLTPVTIQRRWPFRLIAQWSRY